MDSGTPNYPLASQGVFRTIQGEGALLGVPMTFVRLAGCSVGCSRCDTNYRVHRRVTLEELVREVCSVTAIDGWAWITGGEPTDHDLLPLVQGLNRAGLRVALATSGHREIGEPIPWIDWLSVSPHDPAKWVVRRGQELKLVPGLNGFGIRDFAAELKQPSNWAHRFVQPCDGLPDTVRECVEWIESHPEWKITVQAHKLWRLA